MPRIHDAILECVFYLYKSARDAENGEHAGGTGLIVGVPDTIDPESHHLYAVTNKHVITRGAALMRLNTHAGKAEVLATTSENWTFHPAAEDLAVAYLGRNVESPYRGSFIGTHGFILQEVIERDEIGVGDDVFMVGRFTGHAGKQQNRPTVRFGNISAMPGEPIIDPGSGLSHESYLVEARSLSGYSGSPVFLQIPAMGLRPFKLRASRMPPSEISHKGPLLLGVDWAHISTLERVKEKDGKTNVEAGWVVRSNSGMLAVVPAWKLLEVLNDEDFAKNRRADDETRASKKGEHPVVLDSGNDSGTMS